MGRLLARRKTLRLRRRIAVGAAVVFAVLVAGGGAYAYATLPLRRVEVEGARFASERALVRLAAVRSAVPGAEASRDTSIALYRLDPAVVADRVRRHPWVREVGVRRLPTGTLQLRIEEREPAALVLDAAGRPSHYFDAAGHAMPLPEGGMVPFDVPLLRGAVPSVHPTRAVGDPALRDLLAALAGADDATDALISEVVLSENGEATLYTAPAGGHPSIPVRLGRGDAADKLLRLRAFWAQAVLSRPRHPFRVVDLRYTGQVVTREGDGETAHPGARAAAPDSLRQPPVSSVLAAVPTDHDPRADDPQAVAADSARR